MNVTKLIQTIEDAEKALGAPGYGRCLIDFDTLSDLIEVAKAVKHYEYQGLGS